MTNYVESRLFASAAQVRRPSSSSTGPSQPRRLVLSDEQRAVIDAPLDRAVRVLAGPGAGKTVVEIERHVRILRAGVKADLVAAVTYSKAMAVAYGRRLASRCCEVGLTLGPALERNVGTIHSVCWRLLRENRKPLVAVAAPAMLNRLVRELADEYVPKKLRLNEGETPEQHLKSWVRLAKSWGIDDETAVDFFRDQLPDDEAKAAVLSLAGFNSALRERRLITFADMLANLEIRFRRDPAFLKRCQNRIQFILLDEAQDATAQAMRILTILAYPQRQLTIVGDGDQTLYQFLGATPEVNLYDHFETHFPDGLTFHLNTNYRSTPEIVAAQNTLVRHNYAGWGGSTPDRYRKALTARPGAHPGAKITFQMYGGAAAEARGVAAHCRDLVDVGAAQPGDIYVGARTRQQLAQVELALAKAGLPCLSLCGGSFWLLPHIQVVVDYVALALNTDNKSAFRNVYSTTTKQMPAGRRLGPQFLEACGGCWSGIEAALKSQRGWAWFNGARDLQSFVTNIQDWASRLNTADLLSIYLKTHEIGPFRESHLKTHSVICRRASRRYQSSAHAN